MDGILTAFFSRRGETMTDDGLLVLEKGHAEIAAETIHAAVGGARFQILPEKAYPEDYFQCLEVAQSDKINRRRPPLAAAPEHMEDYGTIFLCFPNWWGTVPMAVLTFLESTDLSGRRILPFCTHQGSGMASCLRDLRAACPGARVEDGMAMPGVEVETRVDVIRDWAVRMLAVR